MSDYLNNSNKIIFSLCDKSHVNLCIIGVNFPFSNDGVIFCRYLINYSKYEETRFKTDLTREFSCF